MSEQNPQVTPATVEESYDFLISNDDIVPSGMTELEIYKATIARRYLETGATHCLNPECGSANIGATGHKSDDDWVAFHISCDDCHAEWDDVHKLASVANIVLPEEQGDG